MNEVEFNKFWTSLNDLNSIGVFSVIFRKSEEDKIRSAIADRYGVRDDNKIVLRNIEIIFL